MKKSFALIELIIVLIIISLLCAAFCPVITKKLKASDITVGSFSSNVADDSINSQSDCDKISSNLLFIPKSVTNTKNLCVMKYNVGDDKYGEIWSGVQKCVAGSSCTVENGSSTSATKENLTPTCWLGTTASSCNSNYGGYDGCTRTLCNWTGANKLCTNLGFRLPTQEELQSFTNISYSSNILASDGLMFCDYTASSTTASACTFLPDGCIGTTNNYCYPYVLWSSTFSSASTVYLRGLVSEWLDHSDSIGGGFSTRCVIDKIPETKEDENETEKDNCLTKSNNKCTSCTSGFVLLNGQCLTCEPSNGFVKVADNLCVMQYNIGDGKYGENWNSVQKCIIGNSCTVQNGSSTSATASNLTPTCWQGKTANACNANYGGYDGCTRTVCNWTGGNQMCTNIGWRLPTKAELTSFTNTTYSSSTLSSNGLMFCDHLSSSTAAPVCSFLGSGCTGTYDTNCHPHNVWSSTVSTASLAYYRYLYGQWYDYSASYLGGARSTRCVQDL